MSRKDFELIAKILREICEGGGCCFDDPEDQLSIAEYFASALHRTNERFDREKFIKAALPDVM